MKSILVLMMATLLATATAGSAQTPPWTVPQPPTRAYSAKELDSLEAAQQQASECPFAKALDEANAAWQRLRALCGSVKMGGCGEGACIQTKACNAAGCAAAGCAKGAQEAQAPKCCCAKACACCETCKTATAQTVQAQCPMTCTDPPLFLPTTPGVPMCPSTTGWKMQAGPIGVQIVAQAVPAPPVGMVPNVVYMSANLAAKPAKLVTPDFEAHCDQMIHRGDTIQLIGNVMLLCRKHAQPIRVEGQRIVVNLNDGSFVVEHGTPSLPCLPTPPVSYGYGVWRMSTGSSSTTRPAVYAQPCVPMGERRSVVPQGPETFEVVPVPTVPATSPRR